MGNQADDYSGLTGAGDGTVGSLFPGGSPGEASGEATRPGRRQRRGRTADPDGTGDDSAASGEPSAGTSGGGPADTDPEASARAIILRQLTGSPKSRRQLADKLAERDVPADAARHVLDRFEELQLIDDAAFADAWVRSRARTRGLSRLMLRRELRDKGISDELADAALEQVSSDDEFEMARELVEKKARTMPAGLDHDKGVRRLVSMLGRKGYGPGIAFRVVNEVWPAQRD
ncbi:regulatory protein RecX [Arthrobacter sp. JSM 101049]|uniref:regulatory protein RecX n=1 Tax=Arthrobacter sp. JSM 101049 TaxID=929097 RepID=UPI003563FFC3